MIQRSEPKCNKETVKKKLENRTSARFRGHPVNCACTLNVTYLSWVDDDCKCQMSWGKDAQLPKNWSSWFAFFPSSLLSPLRLPNIFQESPCVRSVWYTTSWIQYSMGCAHTKSLLCMLRIWTVLKPASIVIIKHYVKKKNWNICAFIFFYQYCHWFPDVLKNKNSQKRSAGYLLKWQYNNDHGGRRSCARLTLTELIWDYY